MTQSGSAREKQISHQINLLCDVVLGQMDTLNTLEKRLDRCMSNTVQPRSPDTQKTEESLADIAALIRDIQNIVSINNDKINEFIDRLEV